MNLHPRPHVVGILLVIAALLGACTEGGNDRTSDGDVSLVILSPTASPGTQEPSNSMSKSGDREASESESTPSKRGDPPTLVVGTPRPGESIDRKIPDESAQTKTAPDLADSQFDSDGDGVYTYSDLEHAVEAVLPTYEFPENYQATPKTLLSGFADYKEGGGQWEAGYENILIGLNYFCAWSYTWLDAFGASDGDIMDKSIDRLQLTLQDNPIFESLRDDLLPMVERAELGDPAPLQQLTDINCTLTVFDSTPDNSTPAAEAPHSRDRF